MEKEDYAAPIGLRGSLGTSEGQSHFFMSDNFCILAFNIKVI